MQKQKVQSNLRMISLKSLATIKQQFQTIFKKNHS